MRARERNLLSADCTAALLSASHAFSHPNPMRRSIAATSVSISHCWRAYRTRRRYARWRSAELIVRGALAVRARTEGRAIRQENDEHDPVRQKEGCDRRSDRHQAIRPTPPATIQAARQQQDAR